MIESSLRNSPRVHFLPAVLAQVAKDSGEMIAAALAQPATARVRELLGKLHPSLTPAILPIKVRRARYIGEVQHTTSVGCDNIRSHIQLGE
jgi:hypothetical protein